MTRILLAGLVSLALLGCGGEANGAPRLGMEVSDLKALIPELKELEDDQGWPILVRLAATYVEFYHIRRGKLRAITMGFFSTQRFEQFAQAFRSLAGEPIREDLEEKPRKCMWRVGEEGYLALLEQPNWPDYLAEELEGVEDLDLQVFAMEVPGLTLSPEGVGNGVGGTAAYGGGGELVAYLFLFLPWVVAIGVLVVGVQRQQIDPHDPEGSALRQGNALQGSMLLVLAGLLVAMGLVVFSDLSFNRLALLVLPAGVMRFGVSGCAARWREFWTVSALQDEAPKKGQSSRLLTQRFSEARKALDSTLTLALLPVLMLAWSFAGPMGILFGIPVLIFWLRNRDSG